MTDPLRDVAPLVRRVYAYAAYRVGDGPDAEDVTSATFERALRYRQTSNRVEAHPRPGSSGSRVIAPTTSSASAGGRCRQTTPRSSTQQSRRRLEIVRRPTDPGRPCSARCPRQRVARTPLRSQPEGEGHRGSLGTADECCRGCAAPRTRAAASTPRRLTPSDVTNVCSHRREACRLRGAPGAKATVWASSRRG